MEGEPEIATQISGDEEFYEKIEAPKFVDFTVPDRYCPDDRFWFCLRVGCDRKHEEDIDHEAISKDFILRVMAARSPNVRLRKELNRKTYSIKDQCPLSAPAKSTKSRLSKLALISSIPQKMADTKTKTKPISEIYSTPKLPKAKQVAAKYLTTPSHKICPPNTNKSFRSVQNPKTTNTEMPKNKTVAKALFRSPRKGICVKTSAELRTPLTKICEGIKKLSINSQRKRVLGYSSKSSKEIKRRSICKVKNKVSSILRPSNSKEQKNKSLRGNKIRGVVENESSNMEIDTKLKINDGKNTNTGLADAAKEAIDTKSRNSEEKSIDTALVDAEEKPMGKIIDEEIENGDKENDLVDYNRSCGRNTLGKPAAKINKKVVTVRERNLKEGLKTATTVAQVVKYKKPKPTNPKPFRLRTDERGILREANMEKTNEGEIEKQNRPAERSNADCKLRRKVTNDTTTQRRPNSTKQCEKEREILGEISDKSTRKTKSPSLQPHFMLPIGGASTRKTIASNVKNTETEAGERSNSSRSVSQGKTPKIIAKESNFRGVQKSCSRKIDRF